MFLSFVARTRFQSVLDAFEEDCFFITSCSAKRDDVNPLWRLGMDNGNGYAAKKAERYKALFCVVEPVILKCECRPLKDPRCIAEIEAMSLQVCPTFLSSHVKRIGGVYIHHCQSVKAPLISL